MGNGQKPAVELRFCGDIDWSDPKYYDPWQCCSILADHDLDGGVLIHRCAASDDHTDKHCCVLGHRWARYTPPRRWLARLWNWRRHDA